jgi:hypothetical protein
MGVIFIPSGSGAATALATVPDVASLPAGVPAGSIRYVEDVDAIYIYDGAAWSIISASVSISGIADTATVDLDVTLGVLTANVIQSGIDHGNLTGLADDDHLQYLTTTRADTWLATKDTDDLAEGTTNLYFTNSRADARITAQKGAANGLATLDAGSKIPSAQLPAIAITDTFVVGSQAAMLALTAETGDVAVRTDLSETFILQGTDPTVLADWVMLLTPTDAVISVNGQTGAVSLDSDDVAEGASNLYFTDERAQDAVGTILVDTASVDLAYNDGTPSITATVLPAGVNHDALQNYVANDHIDHSTVQIATVAGSSGLSGGGDLTATRNLVVDITGTTALGADADPADEVMIYDVSGSVRRKVTVAQLGGSASSTMNIRAAEGAGTTTLTVSDSAKQSFSLTADRTVVLPTTGIAAGDEYTINERGEDFALQIQSSGANNIAKVRGGTVKLVALVSTPTAAADWQILENEQKMVPASTVTFASSLAVVASSVSQSISGNLMTLTGWFETGTVTNADTCALNLPTGYSVDSSVYDLGRVSSAQGLFTRINPGAPATAVFFSDSSGLFAVDDTVSPTQLFFSTGTINDTLLLATSDQIISSNQYVTFNVTYAFIES